MENSSRDPKEAKQWKSVHICPQCSHMLNLSEIDLLTATTGIAICPKCDWTGPFEIQIVERNIATCEAAGTCSGCTA